MHKQRKNTVFVSLGECRVLQTTNYFRNIWPILLFRPSSSSGSGGELPVHEGRAVHRAGTGGVRTRRKLEHAQPGGRREEVHRRQGPWARTGGAVGPALPPAPLPRAKGRRAAAGQSRDRLPRPLLSCGPGRKEHLTISSHCCPVSTPKM